MLPAMAVAEAEQVFIFRVFLQRIELLKQVHKAAKADLGIAVVIGGEQPIRVGQLEDAGPHLQQAGVLIDRDAVFLRDLGAAQQRMQAVKMVAGGDLIPDPIRIDPLLQLLEPAQGAIDGLF